MIIDRCRDIEELRRLYESRPMPNQYEFDWLVANPNLFCFYEEKQDIITPSRPSPSREGVEKLRGFITVQIEDGELTLSGTSVRGNFLDNVDAVKMVCRLFKQDICAYTPLKQAGLVLKKAGFVKVDNDKYIRRYASGQEK